jgi:cation transport ATPase
MSSKRTSRKRRKQQRASSGRARPAETPAAVDTSAPVAADTSAPSPADPPDASLARGYARSRAKDEEARANLKPLRSGERPTAVTVGAIVATALAVANVVALAFGYNASEDTVSPGSEFSGSVITTLVVGIVAYGMWRARYWGVLGMQTLLALTLVVSSLALMFANSIWAALLLAIIVAGSGTLFWFLIKAMARIQMPERPGAPRRTS